MKNIFKALIILVSIFSITHFGICQINTKEEVSGVSGNAQTPSLKDKKDEVVPSVNFEKALGTGSESRKPDYVLSLDDTINLAFKNNKNIQIQEKEVLVAKASILDARSTFLPNVSARGSYNRNNKTPQPENIFTGFKNDNKLALSLSQSLYNGENIASFKQAKLGLNVAEETLRANKLDVEFEAKRLYFGLLLAYETERIAQDLLNQAQSHYDDVDKKFLEGTSSKFDLLQSKVQVSKVFPEVVKAKNSVDLISAELKKLLGLNINTAVSLNQKLEYLLMDIDEKEFLTEAYLNQPEMILKSLGIDISKWEIEYAKSTNRPQVNLNGSYSYRSNKLNKIIDSDNNNWNAGFVVSMPIFDGFSSKAKVDAAKAKYSEATLSKEDLSDQIAVDIRRACLDLIQAKAIIDATKDSIEEAKEALRISQISYDNGEGTNLDILDAQVSLSQLEQNYSNSIYDYIMARASLDKTMGRGLPEEKKNENK